MPTYEYRCFKCKKKFDQLQGMNDKVLKRCIHCKGKVERLIGAGAGLIFKGSGFYSTDYKKSKPSSSKDAPPPSKPSVSKDTSPSSKPSAIGGSPPPPDKPKPTEPKK